METLQGKAGSHSGGCQLCQIFVVSCCTATTCDVFNADVLPKPCQNGTDHKLSVVDSKLSGAEKKLSVVDRKFRIVNPKFNFFKSEIN